MTTPKPKPPVTALGVVMVGLFFAAILAGIVGAGWLFLKANSVTDSPYRQCIRSAEATITESAAKQYCAGQPDR